MEIDYDANDRASDTVASSVSPTATTADHKVNLKRTLLPHQLEAVEFLTNAENTLGGGIIADAMGLGKTTSVIASVVKQGQAQHNGFRRPL